MAQILIATYDKLKVDQLNITSPAFENNGAIPEKYTYDGDNTNPPLHIENLPAGTKSLALIIDSPDSPGKVWVHWLVWNIEPTNDIKENSCPGTLGLNDFWEHHYQGPCPPKGKRNYVFHVYALDSMLNLRPRTRRENLEAEFKDHLLAYGSMTGHYSWSRKTEK